MLNITEILIQEFSLQPWQVTNTLALLAEGGTVPFIARYRKERTGELNEIQLRALVERNEYLNELEDRKTTVLKSIEEQGKLTDELRARIERCMQKTELEDLYLPYKPKKRTRATIAREKGLEPLADFIRALNAPEVRTADLDAEAVKFIDGEKGVASAQEALAGASDILAEETAENADLRAHVRAFMAEQGVFRSRVKDEFPEGTTKFEMYRDWSSPVRDIPAHNMLALRRGESEGVLFFDLEFEQPQVTAWLEEKVSQSGAANVRAFYATMINDAFERLMKHTLIGEVRFEKKQTADAASISTFENNLRELLLASPAGMKPTLAIDPGFRTGCKVVAIDRTGKFLENRTIYPHTGDYKRMEAVQTLRDMIERFGTELIAIGNGTAGRETDAFVAEVIRDLDPRPVKVMVNESGASIYSASDVAIDEFPELDLTVRGAISIGRRLMDPLAELVKLDPKSIGVGQYQHDVDQRLLKKKLDDTVESCVNYVGVDLNTASKELLGYVAGLTASVAKNVVAYRNEHGGVPQQAGTAQGAAFRSEGLRAVRGLPAHPRRRTAARQHRGASRELSHRRDHRARSERLARTHPGAFRKSERPRHQALRHRRGGRTHAARHHPRAGKARPRSARDLPLRRVRRGYQRNPGSETGHDARGRRHQRCELRRLRRYRRAPGRARARLPARRPFHPRSERSCQGRSDRARHGCRGKRKARPHFPQHEKAAR
jgi:protein Tex